MDAFSLALSYGINKINFKSALITALIVGIFHFFMPLIGNQIGINLFEYTVFKPKIIMFFIFLLLSLDMFISFFKKERKLRKLNILGILLFAFSVSFDSLSVGLGIRYLYDNVVLVVSTFCIISAFYTLLGFYLGKKLSQRIGKYAFLIGGMTLFVYSLYVLTN